MSQDGNKFQSKSRSGGKKFGDGDRGRGKPRSGGFGKKFGERSEGDRGGFGDRPRKPRGDFEDRPRKPRGEFGDKPRRDFGDKPRRSFGEGDSRSFGDRPRRDSGDRKDFGDRPRKPRGDFGDRKEFGDRPRKPRGDFGDRPPRRDFGERKEFGDRPRRSFGDRPERSGGFGEKRSFGDKPRRDFGDKPRRSFDDRPRKPRGEFDERPRRDFGDKPRRDFGERKEFGDRPRRDFSDKPRRSFDDRPRKSFDERPRKSFDDKPRREYEPREPASAETLQKLKSDRPSFGAPSPYFLYGIHAVTEALLNPERTVTRLITTDTGLESVSEALTAARAAGLERPDAIIVQKEDLARLLPRDAVHQDVMLDCPPLSDVFLIDIINKADENAKILILDQVTDPHNIGAIMRSASAFGAAAVVLQKVHAPDITGTLAKTASGAVEHIPLIREVNLSRALEQLKEAGFFCIGLDERGKKPLSAHKIEGKVAIVLGAEGEGLRRLVSENCDELAKLPTQGKIGSLNVSNAAAIALYELVARK